MEVYTHQVQIDLLIFCCLVLFLVLDQIGPKEFGQKGLIVGQKSFIFIIVSQTIKNWDRRIIELILGFRYPREKEMAQITSLQV